MKGISNLIATVLILAVTISVVSLFAGWAPTIVQDATRGTGEQVSDQIDCNSASLSVEGARYYPTGNRTAVVARNNGNIDLSSVRMEAYKGVLPMNSTNTSIGKGELAEKNITTKNRPSKVRAISTNCTNAEDTSEDIQ